MIKKRNLFSLIAAFVMLVGMIPLAAMPVSAATGDYLTMNLVDPLTGLVNGTDGGYDVAGSIVEVTAVDSTGVPLPTTAIVGWSIFNTFVAPGAGPAVFIPNGPPGAVNPVRVQGDWGEAIIQATLVSGPPITIGKKWTKIGYTEITPAQNQVVTWIESEKALVGGAKVTDKVIGTFPRQNSSPITAPMQGVILNWFLLSGSPTVIPPAVKEAGNWISVFEGLQAARHAKFIVNGVVDGTTTQTVTTETGESTVEIRADGEEAITVVVVPQYPVPMQVDVVPEYTTINFWTYEMEKVPQVRWVGEKIVLEKNWGKFFAGSLVVFQIASDSPGALAPINAFPVGMLPPGMVNTSKQVCVTVDANGLASAILESDDPGQISVMSNLYYSRVTDRPPVLDNQHNFVVYYLKFEELKLSNVVGKRDGHNTGLWTPSNPWDATKDVLEETLNVSQDTLLRARVKGWFMGTNLSTRPAAPQDLNNDGTPDIILPAGRWILPDDWKTLADISDWGGRLHWDIMDNPFDTVDTKVKVNNNDSYGTPLGPYDTKSANGVVTNTTQDVVGPFSPGIELMTPTGWNVQFTSPDPARPYRTVVPNGVVEGWDAPMPPAKIIFQIMNKSYKPGAWEIGNSGFFKEANKAEIYYIKDAAGKIVYTNPFYCEMIPAHQAIPYMANNGGYDWNSFDSTYNPYPFWKIFNRPAVSPTGVPSSDMAGHPTKVEVYSDNHGEAMVYLNGDWNLNLMGFNVNGAADVPNGATVGSTTVQAQADYPYFRLHQPILSNTVTKTWIWGGMVLGTDSIGYLDGSVQPSSLIINTTGAYSIVQPANFPNDVGTSNKKMVWLWLTDRDNMRKGVMNAQVAWRITGGGNSVFISAANGMLSNYNATMQNITLQNGFLTGTGGMKIAGSGDTQGVSYTRAPTTDEADLFAKYYPGYDAANFVVAGVEIMTAGPLLDITVFMDITAPDFNGGFGGATIYRTANVDFASAYPLDDNILMGDANVDGSINMGDVTAVEMGILGLVTKNVNADANGDGKYNMGDVIKIERTILGLP